MTNIIDKSKQDFDSFSIFLGDQLKGKNFVWEKICKKKILLYENSLHTSHT